MGNDHRQLGLAEIAAMPDESNWVALLRERITQIGFDQGEGALPEPARVVFRAEYVVSNTLSGGLSNIVLWKSIEKARSIQSAMAVIGAPRMAEVLQRACDLVAATPPSAWRDEHGPESVALEALEEEFSSIGFDEPDGAVQGFIWRHRQDFLVS